MTQPYDGHYLTQADVPQGGWKVELAYFRQPWGKFCDTASYFSEKVSLFEIWAEVESLRDSGRLPELIEPNGPTDNWHADFYIIINVPGHPHEHPKLLVPNWITEFVKERQDAKEKARSLDTDHLR